MKKIVYIAHPISGNVQENLTDLFRIISIINKEKEYKSVVATAPYVADVFSLNDTIKEERAKGINNNIAQISRGNFDEIWLTGNKLSSGMEQESLLFLSLGKQVRNFINKF